MKIDHTIAILGFNNHEITLSALKQIRKSGCNDHILFFDNGSNPSFKKLIDNAALKKFGVSAPGELDDDKKKEFFNHVDKNWQGDNESD